uniref:DHC_N1 domain-containing protein n=1 Tax=Heterorhabditis bacteriophora TaxID=37862 RepID=A0A1I7WYL8_HETBA
MFAVPTEPASRRKRRRVLSDSSPIDQKKPDTSILCQEPSAKRSAIHAENVVIANNLNFKICFKSLETQHQILIKKCNQNRVISRHSYPVHSFTIPVTGRWEWYILAKIDPSVAVVLSCERSNLTDEEHTAIAEEIMRRITVEPVCKLTKLWATRYAEIKNIYMVSRNITQFKPIPVVNIQEMVQNDRRPEIYNECIKSKVDESINKNSMDTLKNVKVEMKVDGKIQTGCFKTKKIIPTAELINQLLSTNNVEGSSGTSDLINNLPSQKTYLLKLGPYSPNVLEGILRIDVSLIILRRFILHSIRTISSDVLTSFIPLGWPVPFPSIVNISFFEAMRNLLLSHRMFYTKIYKIISDRDLITGFIEKNRKLVEVLRSMIPELEILRDNIVCNDLLECFINTINYYIRKEEHQKYI